MRRSSRRILVLATCFVGAATVFVLYGVPKVLEPYDDSAGPPPGDAIIHKSSLEKARKAPDEYFPHDQERPPQPPEIMRNPPRPVDKKLALHLRGYLSRMQRDEKDCLNDAEVLGDYFPRVKKEPWPRLDEWDEFYYAMGKCDLYRNDSAEVTRLLNALATLPIINAAIMTGGTQVKLLLTFSNNKKAIFKPQRFDLDYETHPNHFYFSDFERSNAEIAAFHLDRILGYRRAVPTSGRVLNITELKAVSESDLKKTFFVSPAKNFCFVGKCDYYCDTTHAICGKPDLVRGSVQAFLPDDNDVPRDHVKSLYRSYSKRNQLAVWQTDDAYCDWKVKNIAPYTNGRRLVDLVDLHIMDFLMGNLDRHHYEAVSVFENTEIYPVHLDNGRGFGKSQEDYVDILAPLYQCCVIRPSTLQTLLKFYTGRVSLSAALRQSLSHDSTAPLLAEKHYVAIERRLHTIMLKIGECLDRHKDNVSEVLRTTYYNPNPSKVEDEDSEDN